MTTHARWILVRRGTAVASVVTMKVGEETALERVLRSAGSDQKPSRVRAELPMEIGGGRGKGVLEMTNT